MRLQARTTSQWENLQEWLCFVIDLKVAVPRAAADMEINVHEMFCVHVLAVRKALKPILYFFFLQSDFQEGVNRNIMHC